MLRSLLLERDQQKQRAKEQSKRADDLHLENLRLQLELERYRRWYYGPRADRLRRTPAHPANLMSYYEPRGKSGQIKSQSAVVFVGCNFEVKAQIDELQSVMLPFQTWANTFSFIERPALQSSPRMT